MFQTVVKAGLIKNIIPTRISAGVGFDFCFYLYDPY